MHDRAAAKVGLTVIIALLVFSGSYFYLSHLNPNTYQLRVAFGETKGLVKQSIVRMQGVRIGEVKEIELDTSQRPMQPIAILSIDKKYQIPEDSHFMVISGILITNPQVEIRPGILPTSLPFESTNVYPGEAPTSVLSALSPELKDTIDKINKSFENLTGKFNLAYTKIDRILDSTQTLLTTVNGAAKAGQGLLADPQLKRDLLETTSNFRVASQNTKLMTKNLSRDLHDVVKSGKGKLDDLAEKFTNIFSRIDSTIDLANTTVKKITDQVTDPRLQQSLQETVELSRTTLARFTQIASDIHQLTGDPRLQNDLKQTVENLKNVTDESRHVVEKVNDLLTKLVGTDGRGPKTPRIQLPKVQLIGNASEQLNPGRLRVDVNARFQINPKTTFDLGFYDLGQKTGLTLQVGKRLTDTLLARYGLYASKIGAGIEYDTKSGVGFQADLWDTNHTRLDVKGLFRVNSDASIWIGADSLFRHPTPLIGIQLKN